MCNLVGIIFDKRENTIKNMELILEGKKLHIINKLHINISCHSIYVPMS